MNLLILHKLLHSLAILNICWISTLFSEPTSSELDKHFKDRYKSLFLPIPITKFTRANLPCISIKIDEQPISVMLDLGFRGQFSFTSEFINKINNKTFLRSKQMWGIRGIEHLENLYEIPEIDMGPINVLNPILHEHSAEFSRETTIFFEGEKPSAPEPGMVGWELFGNTDLLLDLNNSIIAICDSVETLVEQGYDIDTFIKTPLLLERGLVEVELNTSKGPLRCMMDTGATLNHINQEVEMTEIMNIPPVEMDVDGLSQIAFHPLTIKLPIHIEAVLGMEFFMTHVVFLDFAENCTYISKNQ